MRWRRKGLEMIAIFNSLPVREGAADRIVERFAESRGHVQDLAGVVSMEVLRSEGADEVLIVTRWESKVAFDAWGERGVKYTTRTCAPAGANGREVERRAGWPHPLTRRRSTG